MPVTAARKAAMLLANLDPPTAAELLRSAEPELLTEIAAEVACLGDDRQGAGTAADESIREFFDVLQAKKTVLKGEAFARQMLQIILGEAESQEILLQVAQRVQARDPFRQIRSAEAGDIAEALAGESGQTAAIVLSDLPAKKSAELLQLLGEDTRAQAVQCMTGTREVSLEAKLCVAAAVQDRLEQVAKDRALGRAAGGGGSQEQLRKVALLLRGLETDLRDQLVKSLSEQDSETAKAVQKLMVTWQDVSLVAERSLQEVLRSIDARKLALALSDADERISERIRNNISERAMAMLDEEASLLSAPKDADVEEARQEILSALREMNTRGELQFEEG